LDHLAILCQFTGSVTIVHASDDKVHNESMARRMHEAAASRKGDCISQLVMFEGGGHNYIFPLNFGRYADKLVEAALGLGCSTHCPLHQQAASDAKIVLETSALGWENNGGWWKEDIHKSLVKSFAPSKSAQRCAMS
jgi:hypothetical protein